jgi:hypothetical protein
VKLDGTACVGVVPTCAGNNSIINNCTGAAEGICYKAAAATCNYQGGTALAAGNCGNVTGTNLTASYCKGISAGGNVCSVNEA